MISAWWLLLIIPTAFTFGYVLCGCMAIGKMSDKCNNCQYEKFIQDREKKEVK